MAVFMYPEGGRDLQEMGADKTAEESSEQRKPVCVCNFSEKAEN